VRPQQDAYPGLNRGCLRLNWSRSEEAIVTVIGRTARNDYLIPFGLGRDCGSPIPYGRDLFHPTFTGTGHAYVFLGQAHKIRYWASQSNISA
jgi:hypothetical protein